jgi:hypothetical protein
LWIDPERGLFVVLLTNRVNRAGEGPVPTALRRAVADAVQRAVLDAPLEGIVVRYGGPYGPGSSETLAEILRKRMFPVIGNGAGIVSSSAQGALLG